MRNFSATYYTANFGAVLRGVGIMHPHTSARSPQPPFAGPRDVTPELLRQPSLLTPAGLTLSSMLLRLSQLARG